MVEMITDKKLHLGLLLPLLLAAANGEVVNLGFTSFTKSNTGDFFFSNEAGVSQGALQITPDTSNNAETYLLNKSGRVIYAKPFHLWHPKSNTSATFNTSFLINIYRLNSTVTPGEGLAFAILPSLSEPPPGSDAGYLGLTNAPMDGNPSNQFIAIEFDTTKQATDPDSNHLGLDINSIRSNKTVSLSPLGIELAPLEAKSYMVWIDHDSAEHRIHVYTANENQTKPKTPVLSVSIDISKYVAEWSYLGFSASTSTNYELHCVKSWNLTIDVLPPDNKSRLASWRVAIIAVVSSLVVIVAVVGVVTGFIRIKRKKVGDDPNVLAGALKSLPGMPQEFEFNELKKATNNFDEKLKLGQGGFGIVYKGVLAGENAEVAVKKFSRDSTKCEVDFLAELTIINKLRHKHLVKLVGWCHKNGVLLLVYDYMPNGSLDQHLFVGPDGPLLPWHRRYTIVAGVGSALHYLHNEYDQKVVHRDLKASNIMLDSAFNARLGDFGLARALDSDKTSYAEVDLSGVPGTMGYIAPECFHTGKATRESDVYAFGAVVLETVCGRRPRCDISGFQLLVDWVWKLHREGRLLDAVDANLAGEYSPKEARRLLQLGLACSHPAPGERPKAEAIVQVICGAVAPPFVPPFKPAFVWPAAGYDDSATTSTSTAVTSSYCVTSAEWTPRCVSEEAHLSATKYFSMI